MNNFKVVVAYQSFESGLLAVRVYQDVTRRLERDLASDVDFWRFEVFGIASVAEAAAKAAGQANLVMIAVEGDQSLPGECQNWIEKWIDKKAGQDSALSLVSKHSSEAAKDLAAIRVYLRDLALRGNMAFISNPASPSTPH